MMIRKFLHLSSWVGIIALCIGLIFVSQMSAQWKGILFRVIFIAFFEIILVITGIYVWAKLSFLSDNKFLTADDQKLYLTIWFIARNILKVLIILMILCAQLSLFTNFFLMGVNPHWFSILSYICLGIFIQLAISLLLFESIQAVVLFIRRRLNRDEDNTRSVRRKKFNFAVYLALLYTVIICSYGVHNAYLQPQVLEVGIKLPRLHSSFNGFKIALMSDIHLGPTVGRDRLQTAVQIVNSLHADMIVIAGDLVDGTVAKLSLSAEPLKELKSTHGTYFATGNHEYYSGDIDHWFHLLNTSLGVNVLHNSCKKITDKASDNFFVIAGTDDIQADNLGYEGHGMDIVKAVNCSTGQPVILVAHQPKAAKMALDSASAANIELVLSGHTHRGQMFPFMIVAYIANPFFYGHYEYSGKQVYVTQGTFFYGFPFRIGSHMEITLITLHSDG